MEYTYKNEKGIECPFVCNLEDKVIAKDWHGSIRVGKVIALDDDGYVTIETATKSKLKVHSDWVFGVCDYPKTPKVLGRCWLFEVPFVPNTMWDKSYDIVDGDWLVGDFTEGKLWMNNIYGYVVLVQPSGVCLFDYI